MKKIITILVFVVLLFVTGCSDPDPNAIKSSSNLDINAKYNEIELYWEESYFLYDSIRVDIPEDWFGWGQKSDFDEFDKHDLIYQFKLTTITYYSGEEEFETELIDLDQENPTETTVNFLINVLEIDIDSKILIQDEFANDYYFKYDFNDEYYNYCYFKIAKNDVNQLKDGDFNEIRLDLIIYTHIDGSKSYKVKNEDGVTEVGYYDNVGIYLNPEYQN